MSKSLLQKFRRLDAYAKVIDEVRIRTKTGGMVTIICAVLIAFLVCRELAQYLTPVMEPEIMVDGGKTKKLPVTFNITFPHMPCYLLGLDIMDEGGDFITDYDHNVYKVHLDSEGRKINVEKTTDLGSAANAQCGDCYGAAPPGSNMCCNTCDDVRKAYADAGWQINEKEIAQCQGQGGTNGAIGQSHEGCNMYGTILMSRTRGNFHFSPGRVHMHGSQHIHDIRTYLSSGNDFRHEIHYLWFGDQKYSASMQKRTKAEGLSAPLDNTVWGSADAGFMYQYFLKIVHTQFLYLNGNTLWTFQYSVTRQQRNLREQPAGGLPGVFFHLDFSPMLIVYSETRASLASFLTGVCAIVGGVFTIARVIDGVLYNTLKPKAAKSS